MKENEAWAFRTVCARMHANFDASRERLMICKYIRTASVSQERYALRFTSLEQYSLQNHTADDKIDRRIKQKITEKGRERKKESE